MTPVRAPNRSLQLVTSVVDSWTPTLVEAVDGSGKHALALAAARHLGVAHLTRLDHSNWAEMIGSDDAVVIVEGAATATDLSIDARLASALEQRLSEQPCIIIVRRIGSIVRDYCVRADLAHLTEHDLWFDLDTTTATLAGDHTAAALALELTSGWPALINHAAEHLRHNSNSEGLPAVLTRALDDHMRETLAVLPIDRVHLLSQLATLDGFNDHIALFLGSDGGLDDLVQAGIPLLPSGRDWYRLPDPVRSWLRSSADVPAEPLPQKLYDHLVDIGRPVEAIESALSHGQHSEAAATLAELTFEQSLNIDPSRLEAAVSRLGTHIADQPRGHLVRARIEQARGSVSEAASLLEDVSGRQLPSGLAEEFRAELAFYRYLGGDLDTARSLVLGPENTCAEPVAEARRVEVEAGLAALDNTAAGLDRAGELYDRAAQLWHNAGQPTAAAGISFRLAVEVEMKRGRLATAVQLLEQAERAALANPTTAAVRRLLRARVLALLGETDDAREALIRSQTIIESSGIGLFRAYEQATQMILASQAGEAGVVARCELRMHASTDPADATRALLLGDQIDSHLRLGDRDSARARLTELETHAAAEAAAVAFSVAQVECAFGDPSAGRNQVVDLYNSDTVTPRGRWRLVLAEAVAAARLGEQDEAERLLHTARALAAEVGTPGIIDRAEAWALALITGASAPMRATDLRERCHVAIFNSFAVTISGSPVSAPRGRPRTLLKILILNDGAVSIDVATDALWPGEDPTLGRQRLRNILTRLRSRYGPVVERDGPTLRLIPSELSSDYGQWTARADAQHLDPDDAELEDLIAIAPIELSAEDRYEEWFQPLEHRYRVELLRLIDKRIEAAIANRDTPRALALYHRSLDVDPHAQERIDLAVDLATSAGLPDDAATFERRRESD